MGTDGHDDAGAALLAPRRAARMSRGAPGAMPRAPRLPGHGPRPHDDRLAVRLAVRVEDAASGHGGVPVPAGFLSVGKTSTAREALRLPGGRGRRPWRPAPTDPDAFPSGLEHLAPHPVIRPDVVPSCPGAGAGRGERAAAALRRPPSGPAPGPVLVRGALSSGDLLECTTPAGTHGPLPADEPGRVREPATARMIAVPDEFDGAALAAPERKAADGAARPALALRHAGKGRVARSLATAPAQLQGCETAPPPARALLEAATDDRCLDLDPHLVLAFPRAAAGKRTQAVALREQADAGRTGPAGPASGFPCRSGRATEAAGDFCALVRPAGARAWRREYHETVRLVLPITDPERPGAPEPDGRPKPPPPYAEGADADGVWSEPPWGGQPP
ncbi:hypothetical protein GQF42_32770 [Streptomyces broussonetiae]|uniref:Uncharacterized protein n=1 Tax=Streptomyces broussonetiae TaxID=2686304 RepID=A0A6I6N2N5_9ACTN|nr:hypothetical protein [Streptomyces broussonetiae]QHA07448.1 hypothetical protein GQF42_32770 [Streptomyces broussonetiae]